MSMVFIDADYIDSVLNSTLSEREKSVVEMMMSDYTQRDISKHLGVSQPQVSRELTKIRKKLNKFKTTLTMV